MPSPPTEEGSDVPTTKNYVQVANEVGHSSGQEVLGGARVSTTAAVVAETETRSAPTCCVCMEPWSCIGAHRICCIPCGHVYGRSCLEKWLGACGNTSAKCPQCGAGFEQKHIINIYTPGDLFDGCSPMQEVEAHYSKITEFRARVCELLDQHASEDNMGISHAKVETSNLEIPKAKASLKELSDCMNRSWSLLEMQFRHYMELATLVGQNLDGLGEGDPK